MANDTRKDANKEKMKQDIAIYMPSIVEETENFSMIVNPGFNHTTALYYFDRLYSLGYRFIMHIGQMIICEKMEKKG